MVSTFNNTIHLFETTEDYEICGSNWPKTQLIDID